MHCIILAESRKKEGLLVGCDPHLSISEMLPYNSLTVAGLQIQAVPHTVAALFWWHFVAFLNLVLNRLKGFSDWNLLGHES